MNNISFIQDILKKLQRQQGQDSPLPVIGGAAVTPPFNPNATALPAITPTNPTDGVAPLPEQPFMVHPAPEIARPEGSGSVPMDVPQASSALPAIGPPPPIERPLMPEQKLAALDAKDYSIRKDENGNVIHRGKDRDKKWSLADKILSAITGWAQGGLAGGVKAATDRNYFEKLGDQNQRERILPQIAAKQQIGKYESDMANAQTQRENVKRDNAYQDARLEEFRADRRRKEDDRYSRERTSRMNAVAGMFKNIPSFDPNDPKFKEMKEALGDVNLPVTPKDAKKKVDLKQDQRTGLWTVILTDPASGAQEVRNVMKDGKPFTSTPTVVMQGEYGLLRQNDAQTFQADEAQKKREYDARMKAAEAEARLAFNNLAAAQGRQKALETERAKFIAAYRKEAGVLPTEEQINEYLNAVAGQ